MRERERDLFIYKCKRNGNGEKGGVLALMLLVMGSKL
jgi:hypothetical protein